LLVFSSALGVAPILIFVLIAVGEGERGERKGKADCSSVFGFTCLVVEFHLF